MPIQSIGTQVGVIIGEAVIAWPCIENGLRELKLARYIKRLEDAIKEKNGFIYPNLLGVNSQSRQVRVSLIDELLTSLDIEANRQQLNDAYQAYRQHTYGAQSTAYRR